MDEQPYPTEIREYLYKILVIGDLGTGKTSIIKRYVHNIFSMNYKSTVSASSCFWAAQGHIPLAFKEEWWPPFADQVNGQAKYCSSPNQQQ
jgi:hypothetical protein